MKIKGFEWTYAVLVFLDLFAMYQYPGLRLITKPLIVSSLIIWYIIQTQEAQQPIVLTALLFALIGDIFLLFDYPLFFQMGIAAFLIMQICYIYDFKRYYVKPVGLKLYFSIGIFLIALFFDVFFFDKLGTFQIHVIVYSLAIAIMVFFGINQSLSKFIVVGSCFFLMSDFSLAYHKFIAQHALFPYFIMITYVVAQYSIVQGLCSKERLPKPMVASK
jgi:uncharacterized membrane protein YhhN